jgi:hypothetical protein
MSEEYVTIRQTWPIKRYYFDIFLQISISISDKPKKDKKKTDALPVQIWNILIIAWKDRIIKLHNRFVNP